MASRSLRPQLNQIRAWVKEGRTDAWIAHQLEVSASELRDFRRRHELSAEAGTDDTDDLRDEIEAEVEAATREEEAEAAEGEDEEEDEPAEPEPEADGDDDDGDDEGSGAREPNGGGGGRRRRRRRGGRGRRRKRLEATFDHGEKDGYGLWLDAAVKDNGTYREHWQGHREVEVSIEPDQIVIRRS